MDGGIGESALMGALISGGVGLATGKNPLQAALLGGLTGGAMSGITGALGGAGADATQGVVQAADSGIPALDTSVVDAGGVLSANPNVVNAAMNGVDAYGSSLANSGMIQGASGTYFDPEYLAAHPEIAATQTATTQAAQAGAKAAADAATKSPGILGSLKNTWSGLSMPEKVGVGIAGSYGINQLMKPPVMVDPNIGKPYYSGPKLHNLSPDFKGTDVPQPQPYYTASYAEGGIADLASGGQLANAPVNVDFMGGDMYPQSQQQRSFYATPTQMPTSAQQALASYEPNTNPLTGQPTAHMAEGGIAGYAAGGTPAGGQVYYDPVKKSYYTQADVGGFGGMLTGPSGVFGGLFNANNVPGFDQMSSDPNSMFYNGRTYLSGSPSGTSEFQALQVTPEVYQQSYADQASQAAPSQATQQYLPQSQYSLADSMPLLQASNPELAARMASSTKDMAEGGIANLGSYSDGGHLLKGPGDGMSDSIPASIGGKQPARLATGEFVVPADVVSHLGNGSTDAGAKHLYAMMDKVRHARTGRKSQGKQINASNYLPA